MLFMGEHLTDACRNITNSNDVHASLIPETKQIKLASGTSNLSHMHPVLIAVQAAMFDHLAEGRFILGVSPGASRPTPSARHSRPGPQQMFAEAIDVILPIWERDPPYDIDFPDNRYKVSDRAHDDARSRRRHHGQALPEAAAGDWSARSGAVLARRGADGPSATSIALRQLFVSCHLKSHWQNYCKGKARGRRRG